MMLVALAILSAVMTFGYDLGNHTHYTINAVAALGVVIAFRAYRAYTE